MVRGGITFRSQGRFYIMTDNSTQSQDAKPAYGLGRAARLNLAFEMLEELATGTRTLDAIVGSRFKHMEEVLERRDRRDLEGRLRSVMLHYARLLWWIKRVKLAPSTRMLVLADMVINEKTDMEQLQKLCNGAFNRMSMLSKEEIAGLKRLIGKPITYSDMPEATQNECPLWAYKGLKDVFGEQFAEESRALNNKPATDLRVNTLVTTREEAQASLKAQGIQSEAMPLSPNGLRLAGSGGPILSETEAFRKGWIENQDEGSQLVAALVGAKKGMQVIDFCAGAGGKSLALAAHMENGGHLVACDIHTKRLQRAKVRFKRAGVVNAERRPLEQTFDKWVKKSRGKFDRVLIDAPCSGTGTWRRNPDSKWKKDDTDLKELVALQAEILDSACRLAKSGGRVVYATCSLLPEENEQQIEAFLARHPEFKQVSSQQVWTELFPDTEYPCGESDHLRLTPHQHGCDGFFAAILEKQ